MSYSAPTWMRNRESFLTKKSLICTVKATFSSIIKYGRLKWAGHIARIEEIRNRSQNFDWETYEYEADLETDGSMNFAEVEKEN